MSRNEGGEREERVSKKKKRERRRSSSNLAIDVGGDALGLLVKRPNLDFVYEESIKEN